MFYRTLHDGEKHRQSEQSKFIKCHRSIAFKYIGNEFNLPTMANIYSVLFSFRSFCRQAMGTLNRAWEAFLCSPLCKCWAHIIISILFRIIQMEILLYNKIHCRSYYGLHVLPLHLRDFKTNNGSEFIKYLHLLLIWQCKNYRILAAARRRETLHCLYLGWKRFVNGIVCILLANICISVNQILLLVLPTI